MTTITRQLDLFERRQQQRDEDVAILTSHLLRLGRWQTRDQLCRALQWTERRVRAAGEAANGVVIFGQHGMRHIRGAAVEEVQACCNTLFSQARRNSERAVATQRAYHQWGGPATANTV